MVTKQLLSNQHKQKLVIMSISQENLLEADDNYSGSIAGRKKRNRVNSPLPSYTIQKLDRKQPEDVFELFTVKSQPISPPRAKPRQKRLPAPLELSQETISDVSDAVFKAVSTPSKSDTKSYRDRINARFKNIKQNAGKSSHKAKVRTEEIRLEKVKRENEDVEGEVEAWRARLQQKPDNNINDFFLAIAKPENEETKDTKEEFDVVYSRAENISSKLRKAEEESFFIAKAKPVDFEDKIVAEFRNRELEGLYVPKGPKIPNRHKNILEQRLSRDNKKWFNCEGNLEMLENPISVTSYRPLLKPLPSMETLDYSPATIEEECNEIVIVKENTLLLEIGSLKFKHHPLFSLEHIYEQKLRKLIQEYEFEIAKNTLERLKHKLEALRKQLRQFTDEERITSCKDDIKILQETVFTQGKSERERIKAILKTWKTIKQIRDHNKYSNTSIKLIIIRETMNYEEEHNLFIKNFNKVLNEMLLEKNDSSLEEEYSRILTQRFQESFRPAGEPILHFNLSEDNEITKNINNSKEITRRNVVSSTKVALKITCNKMEVCKTKFVNLQQNFNCTFDEIISIQLVNIPKSINIEIIEQPKGLVKRNNGEMRVKLPPRNIFKDNKKKTNHTFEKQEIVHYKHEGVGSGFKIGAIASQFIDSEDEEVINTSGSVDFTMAWGTPRNAPENPNFPNSSDIINQIIDKNGAIDYDKLSEWVHQNKPDPQDPKNAILYEYSMATESDFHPINKGQFRLNPHLERLQFCNTQVLDDNLRLTILQLRNRNEPEFDRMLIPNRIKEIPLNLLEDYKRRVSLEQEHFEDHDEEFNIRRNRGRKYLKQVHTKVFQQCKNSEYNLTFEDVVNEKFLSYFEDLIKDLIRDFLNWFKWRPLKSPMNQEPLRKTSKLLDYQLSTQAKIIIRISSALNLPEKNKGEIRPFVEFSYANSTVRTLITEGVNPTWNEELILPLEAPHVDYLNPNSLKGVVSVSIFDESENTLPKFGGVKGRSLLGYLEISLSAICSSELQGMFKVKVPHILLGFKNKMLETMVKSPRITPQNQINQQTYLNLSIRVEPTIPKITPSIEELPSGDVPYVREHALRWNQNYNINYPSRKFSVFAIDTNSLTTCIVRYIKPLEPPQLNTQGFDVTPDQCARFVSLIPFTQSNQFYENIWLSVDEFTHLMVGSIIDHAVALTCYLLALKLEAWLVLGYGIPHGSTAYVLVKDYDSKGMPNYYIYDPKDAEKVYLTDTFCPLQKIYCIINDNNLWANTQRNDNVNVMRFDLTRKSDWLPLFNSKITTPTNSVHGIFTYLPPLEGEEIEVAINRKFRKKIAKLRQLDRTIWNHQVSNAFRNIMKMCENSLMFGASNAEVTDRIKECMASYSIKGCVLSVPFYNVSSIVKLMKTFGFHMEDDSNAQFASAAFVRSYPNQVVSVWIFAAALIPKLQNYGEMMEL